MKKPIIISLFCVALAVALFLWGFGQGEGPRQKTDETYALVIENDTGAFVMQLQKGMRQAAEEAGAHLMVCSLNEAEKAEGLSGVALWLDDPTDALERLHGLPLVTVGQSCQGAVCIQSDDGSAGEQLMARALELAAPEQVLLIRDDQEARGAVRGEAAQAAGGLRVARIAYGERLMVPESCQVAIAVSPRATQALAELKRAGGFAGAVLGVDTGDSRVSDLENGWVAAMALDSPYAMGYRALEALRELHSGGQPQNAATRVLLADQRNMYLAENVKQVFPLLQ